MPRPQQHCVISGCHVGQAEKGQLRHFSMTGKVEFPGTSSVWLGREPLYISHVAYTGAPINLGYRQLNSQHKRQE